MSGDDVPETLVDIDVQRVDALWGMICKVSVNGILVTQDVFDEIDEAKIRCKILDIIERW